VEDIKRKITKNTKAIVPVHYAGHPCELDPIMEIAKKKGIYVVEDAAHACGAEYKGRKIGSISHYMLLFPCSEEFDNRRRGDDYDSRCGGGCSIKKIKMGWDR
jgi:hypothetical protein